MEQAETISVRIDGGTRRRAEALCEEMGLTLGAACAMLMKAIVRTRSIPFRLEAGDPFWSEADQAHLRASIEELDAGLGRGHELIDA